jgi:hypothetical protein
MPDFGIFRGFNEKLFGDKLYAGQLPTQLGIIGSENVDLRLLDLYPNAAAAYSLRKLRTDYTGSAIRVRRTDLDELDIGFTSTGELDTAALLAFTGTGALDDGFVTKWYDQSSNGKDATQTTAVSQPKIVSSGFVINVNSKPSLSFDSVNDRLVVPSSTSYFKFLHDGTKFFISSVNVVRSNASSAILGNNAGATAVSGISVLKNASNKINILITRSVSGTLSAAVTTTTNYNINTQNSLLIEGDILNPTANDRLKVYINNSLANQGNTQTATASNTDAFQNFQIASYDLSSAMDGNFQELVLWNSDQSVNKNGINTNMNTFYSIF